MTNKRSKWKRKAPGSIAKKTSTYLLKKHNKRGKKENNEINHENLKNIVTKGCNKILVCVSLV